MTQSVDRTSARNPLAFLANGGEMAQLIRAFDWSGTPLGPIESWTGSLQTAVSICIASDLPICIIWGPNLIQIYNDSYRLICGGKHPRSLGQNFAECWREAWPVIGEAHDSALAGNTAFLETQRIFLDRYGYTEECFFTFSFSPIRDEAGEVSGLFHPVIEMTAKMLGERRTQTLRDVASKTADATTVEQACSLAASSLEAHALDAPFILLYLLSSDGQTATLSASACISAGTTASPHSVEINTSAALSWPLADVLRTGQTQLISDVQERFAGVTCGPYPEGPRSALALALKPPGSDRPIGVLISGVSSRLTLSQPYLDFHELLGAAVTTALANGRAFEDQRRRAESLTALDHAKTAFFSNVSHEFRTPLTLMLGPIEDMLERDDVSPGVSSQLQVVNRNGLRLLRLVNTLLDFSRLEAGRARATFEPTDLSTFTSGLASVFRSACDRAGLTLTVECQPIDELVFVDRDMWEKIVLNLLSNAFKFTFDGEVVVALARCGDSVELLVRDTGTGIPPHEMSRLFERFHRIENARSRTHEGSGIGLSLIQELVRLHGGSITADSVLDEGTTFTVSLPLGSAHLPIDQIADSSHSASASTFAMPFVEEALRWLPDLDTAQDDDAPDVQVRTASVAGETHATDLRPRVLIADDNADMRQHVVRLLAEHFRTETVPDGEAALEAVRRRKPNIVLSDVMMPRLDGFGLVRALRADPDTRDIPVLLLSARAGEESRVEGMDSGADDYLIKPFGARELLARVRALLQMAHMRRDSTEMLRQSEERLRMALSAAQMVAWQLDTKTGAVVVSNNVAGVFGLKPDTTVDDAETWLALVHPDDRERHRGAVETAIATCGSYFSEFRMIRADNHEVSWMEERGHAIPGESGAVSRLIGVVMDISERKAAQAIIGAGEQQTRTILESITDGLFTLDRDWRFTYINAAGEQFLDRTPGDLIGKRLWDEFPGTAGSEFQRVYERVAWGGVAESFTAHYPNFDRWYEVSAYPAPAGLSVYFRDVTAQRRIEQRLKESEEGRRIALDDAELGAWNVDPTTKALKTDSRFRTIFGIIDELTDYLQVFDLIHHDDLPAVKAAVAASTRLDDPQPYAIEYRIIHPDGSIRWVFAKGRLLTGGAGSSQSSARFDGTVSDITDRKLAEQEREYLVGQLREQDTRKDEFLATLAHELRNPLAPMSNGLQIMRHAGLAGNAEKARVMMDRQLTQMVRLVDDLLDVSRITRGKLELRKQRIDLTTAINLAVEIARPLLGESGPEMTVSLNDESIFVDGDQTRLAQVVSNLLANSAKYTLPSGQIRLTVEREQDMVCISVSDDGIGIPAVMLSSVFDMFTQVDRSLEKTTGGLGIGLSLSKALVEMHGGTIEARSDGEGRGSEFVVRLPIAASGVQMPAGDIHDDQITVPMGGRRVLVVDDNEDAADTLAMLLQQLGHDVRTASDGEAGVSVAEAFRPDVVLLDIGMPRLNGYDACRRIRQQAFGRDVTIVAITGWGQADDKRLAAEAGFDAHLVKPVDNAALQKVLARTDLSTRD